MKKKENYSWLIMTSVDTVDSSDVTGDQISRRSVSLSRVCVVYVKLTMLSGFDDSQSRRKGINIKRIRSG